jgi:hypothetical protein
VLVNDIWEPGLDKRLRILRLAIHTHLITSHLLLPLLVGRPRGRRGDRRHYGVQRFAISLSVFYDLAKVAVNRLVFSQGHELTPH